LLQGLQHEICELASVDPILGNRLSRAATCGRRTTIARIRPRRERTTD
jgi:hypothetical protein